MSPRLRLSISRWNDSAAPSLGIVLAGFGAGFGIASGVFVACFPWFIIALVATMVVFAMLTWFFTAAYDWEWGMGGISAPPFGFCSSLFYAITLKLCNKALLGPSFALLSIPYFIGAITGLKCEINRSLIDAVLMAIGSEWFTLLPSLDIE